MYDSIRTAHVQFHTVQKRSAPSVRKERFGTILEAPVPERSGLVKNNASLVKYMCVHAPWNCRGIETQARGPHIHTYNCTYEDHYNLLHRSPLLKKTRVRQVASEKRFPLRSAAVGARAAARPNRFSMICHKGKR